MNAEKERLNTFESWPSNAIIEKGKIAKAGFYYLGNGFNVKCYFCGLIISDWKYGDKVMLKHKLLNPDCIFVKNHLNCNNIPSHEVDCYREFQTFTEELQTYNSEIKRNSKFNKCDKIMCAHCGYIYNENNAITAHFESSVQYPFEYDSEQLDVLKHRTAAFPRYSTYEERYTSFPKKCNISSELFAAAGFFYKSGTKNEMICYHCGGILPDWSNNDDPWIQHARYFPNCDFLRLMKEDNFIDEVLNISESRNKNMKIEHFLSHLQTPDTSNNVNKNLVRFKQMRKVSDTEISRALECSVAKEALKKGLEKSQVRNVVHARLSGYGRMFDCVNDLLESLSSPVYQAIIADVSKYIEENYVPDQSDYYEDIPDSYFPWRLRHRFGSPYYYFRRLMLLRSRQLIKPEFYGVVPLTKQTAYYSVNRNRTETCIPFNCFQEDLRTSSRQNDLHDSEASTPQQDVYNGNNEILFFKTSLNANTSENFEPGSLGRSDTPLDQSKNYIRLKTSSANNLVKLNSSTEIDRKILHTRSYSHESPEIPIDGYRFNRHRTSVRNKLISSSSIQSDNSNVIRQPDQYIPRVPFIMPSKLISDNFRHPSVNSRCSHNRVYRQCVTDPQDGNQPSVISATKQEPVLSNLFPVQNLTVIPEFPISIFPTRHDGSYQKCKISVFSSSFESPVMLGKQRTTFTYNENEFPNSYKAEDLQDTQITSPDKFDFSTQNEITIHSDDYYKTKAKCLEQENEKLKDSRLCKVCMDNEISIIFLKCGHLCVCSNCAATTSNCPICRETIIGAIRAYLS